MNKNFESDIAYFKIENNFIIKEYKEEYHYIFSNIEKFDILKSLVHKNIIGLKYYDSEKKIMILDFFKNSNTLIHVLKEIEVIECSKFKNIFFELAYTIDFLHSNGLVHGDISVYNILINKNLEIKLNDFDWIEIINFNYDKQVDIISFQRIFFQLIVYKKNLNSIRNITFKINNENKIFNSCLEFLETIDFTCI